MELFETRDKLEKTVFEMKDQKEKLNDKLICVERHNAQAMEELKKQLMTRDGEID